MPIDDRVYPHEIRPALVRPIKVGEVFPMWICSPRPDKDSLNIRMLGEVKLERIAKGDPVLLRCIWGGRRDVG